jgi:DNA polymerase-3 subunit alpha
MLTSEGDTTAKVVRHIHECKEMGLEVLPPDVNESDVDFTVVGDTKIRFGLSAIKGVGRSAVESILEARRRVGRFITLSGFCSEIDLRLNNRKVLEALVKAGALDGLGASRSTLMASLDMACESAQALRAERESGQASLFGDLEAAASATPDVERLPEMPPWTTEDRLKHEKEVLGFYVSGHPLEKHRDMLSRVASAEAVDLPEKHGQEVTVAGIVAALRKTRTKKGDWMAFITLEDLTGQVEVIAFPTTWAACQSFVETDAALCVKGNVEVDGDRGKVLASEVISLGRAQQSAASGVLVRLPPALSGPALDGVLRRILAAIEASPGDCPVYIEVSTTEVGTVLVKAGPAFGVKPDPSLVQALEDVVGAGAAALRFT